MQNNMTSKLITLSPIKIISYDKSRRTKFIYGSFDIEIDA